MLLGRIVQLSKFVNFCKSYTYTVLCRILKKQELRNPPKLRIEVRQKVDFYLPRVAELEPVVFSSSYFPHMRRNGKVVDIYDFAASFL